MCTGMDADVCPRHVCMQSGTACGAVWGVRPEVRLRVLEGENRRRALSLATPHHYQLYPEPGPGRPSNLSTENHSAVSRLRSDIGIELGR